MSLALAATVGALFALGTFLLLRRDLVNVVLGTAIITQAANIYLIAMGGIAEGTNTRIPVLSGHEEPFPTTADPLVQAMVLTAIVISFGMTAFLLVLAYRAYQENETMDVTEWSQ
ncbi:MAG: multicomponent Na+:H+ antiporter subunit C [Halovenus sp.]|jgi:multicomponent Na+:H+ antiporter subunit C